MAQTYNIYDYRALPARYMATLVSGLGEESRLKRKISNQKYDLKTILLAGISDRLSYLLWINSKDGKKGRNRPKLMTDMLIGNKNKKRTKGYMSGEAFEKARLKIIEGKNG